MLAQNSRARRHDIGARAGPARGLTAPRSRHSRIWGPAGHFMISQSCRKDRGAVRGEKDAIRPWSGVAFSEVRWPALRIVDSATYAGGGGRSETRMAGREGVGGFGFVQKMRIKSEAVFHLPGGLPLSLDGCGGDRPPRPTVRGREGRATGHYSSRTPHPERP